MTRLQNAGVTVDLPPGWEGRVKRRNPAPGVEVARSAGDGRLSLVHAATFPLPVDTEDFGGRAVEQMRGGDALVTLVEYGPESVGTALFASQGMPRRLTAADFDENMLQHNHPGQTGCQRFFVEADRAWCLYVVLGRHLGRSRVVPRVNEVLRTVRFG